MGLWEFLPGTLVKLLPESKRFELREIKIKAAFEPDIKKARERGDYDSARGLDDRMYEELHYLAMERQKARSSELLAKAYRLHLPLPPHSEDGEETGYWERLPIGGRVLTREGMLEVKEAIRAEERWSMERRKHWIALLSSVTGLLGTIIGLVSVLG